MVTPQSWLFAKSYSGFRKGILQEYSINMIAQLGARAFETISGEVVNVNLNVFTSANPDNFIRGIDVSGELSPMDKSLNLSKNSLSFVAQKAQLKNPDFRISIETITGMKRLSEYAEGLHGQGTFDKGCFSFNFL